MITANDYLNASAPKSYLGFGAMRLPDDKETAEMIDLYLDSGFNYFDTAWIYGGSEEMLKRTLVKRHPRDRFFVANKMPPWEVKNHKDCDTLFAEQLRRTGLDYFDFYLIHSLDNEKEKGIESMALFDWAAEQKRKGLVKHVGFSFHGDTPCLERAFRRYPEAEFVQLQLNYVDILRGPAGEWQDLAVKHNVPIIVMEPVKGGSLANLPASAEKILKDYAPERSIASWAIQYAATLKGATCVLSGMSNMQQMRDNLKTYQNLKPLTEEEMAMLERVLVEMGKVSSIPCTACKYCHPNCPMEIDIASSFALYNEYKRGGDKWNRTMMYRTLPEGKRAHDCTSCGACMSHCPQHLDIPTGLSTVADTFGG
ncbi:MAG: aldo/keto reductase [Defluviitaleaceae bacterium]|nr:aldo/keto reductase [Defluviitaleaceae bacterium]